MTRPWALRIVVEGFETHLLVGEAAHMVQARLHGPPCCSSCSKLSCVPYIPATATELHYTFQPFLLGGNSACKEFPQTFITFTTLLKSAVRLQFSATSLLSDNMQRTSLVNLQTPYCWVR